MWRAPFISYTKSVQKKVNSYLQTSLFSSIVSSTMVALLYFCTTLQMTLKINWKLKWQLLNVPSWLDLFQDCNTECESAFPLFMFCSSQFLNSPFSSSNRHKINDNLYIVWQHPSSLFSEQTGHLQFWGQSEQLEKNI